jgi:predicted peptidase
MMMNKLFATGIGMISLLTLNLSAQDAPKSSPDTGQTPRSFELVRTERLQGNYLLFLPSNFDRNKPWPLLLFLHGAGERGSDLHLVTKHGPPRIVSENPDFPFILVSPQCPAGETWSNETLLALLEVVSRDLPVDPKRIYLTGLSMGGYGAWSLAMAYPEKFAAVAPICGGGSILPVLLTNPAKRAALRALPVWAFHGAKDNVVQLSESERMIDALKRIGNPAKLTVYPEAGHDSWTETYENQELFDWFLQHEKTGDNSNP